MFPDGVLNEGYFAAPSDADETRAAAEIVTAKARKRLKLRRYMLSSCSIERRIGGTGQVVAKRRQSLPSVHLRERDQDVRTVAQTARGASCRQAAGRPARARPRGRSARRRAERGVPERRSARRRRRGRRRNGRAGRRAAGERAGRGAAGARPFLKRV